MSWRTIVISQNAKLDYQIRNKKIINALYSEMLEVAMGYEVDKSRINSELIELLDKITYI